jgi:thiol-disulfide isomerase/thioredoxin
LFERNKLGGVKHVDMQRGLLLLGILALAPVLTAQPLMTGSVTAMVGKKFPELKVDFVGKKPVYEGKARVVEFWATWCPPCRASIPHLNETYHKFKEKGLVVIGITDEDKDKVESFRTQVPIDYSVAANGEELIKQLNIEEIPHAFVLNKKGVVVWDGDPMEIKEETLEKVLAE